MRFLAWKEVVAQDRPDTIWSSLSSIEPTEDASLATYSPSARPASTTYEYRIPFVIGASAIGTVIEWYDFYLYAVLATFLAPVFFPGDTTSQTLSALATFGGALRTSTWAMWRCSGSPIYPARMPISTPWAAI